MDFSLELRFGKSSSQNYPRALRLGEQFKHFTPLSDENDKNIIVIDKDELRQKRKTFGELWFLVQGWRSSELLVNGKQAPLDYYEYLKVIECNEGYYEATNQQKYCSLFAEKEGWSCKFLTDIGYYLPTYHQGNVTYWYHFGRFVSDKIWQIDKLKLKESLEREIRSKKLECCDIFDLRKVEQIVNELADVIDVSKSDTWEILYKENPDGSIIEGRPVGIIPKHLKRNEAARNINIVSLMMGDNKKKEQNRNRYIPKVTFDEIGGIDEIIQQIREIVELPLKQPALFKNMSIKPHKGILLYGPPGCGKTLIAKAIANEVKAHFISIKGPELLSKWHGESEHNLRVIFEEGRELQPSIVFFDEIDSVAQIRSGAENLRFDARFVNQLLTLMDGIEEFGNVCVIGSTNRVELIDPALLRPGRFDYTIEVKKPTKEGCYKIFSIATSGMPVAEQFDSKSFSGKLVGLSGADIAFIAREASYNCLRRNLDLKDLIAQDNNDIDVSKLKILEEDFRLALEKCQSNIK